MAHVLGIDVGTTGVRSIVWSQKAQSVGYAYERLETNYENENATQDPLLIFDTVVKVAKLSLADAKMTAKDISCMGLATQRASFTIWNRSTGNPVIPLILWKDQRTQDELSRLNKKISIGGFIRMMADFLFQFTGSPQMLTASQFTLKTHHLVVKLKQLLEQDTDLRKRVESGEYLFGTLDTWLLWKLTGGKRHLTDLTNASCTCWWDPYTMSWGKIMPYIVSPLPGEYFPPESLLPTVADTSSDFGVCDESIFGYPISINALVADQPASLFAQGCWDKGDAKITLGTGGFVQVNTGLKCLAALGAEPVALWRIGNEQRFGLEATHNDVGPCIDWIVRNKFAGVESYASLNEISKTFTKPTSVCFIPALNSGLSSPYNSPSTKAMFVGFTESTTKQDLLQAMLQSIGLRVAQMTEQISRNLKVPITVLRVDGGVCEDDFIMQFMADITGAKVIRPSQRDMTSLGAAFLAGLSKNVWKRSELKSLIVVDRVFEPSKLTTEERTKLIENFHTACLCAKSWGEVNAGRTKTLTSWGSRILLLLFVLWVAWSWIF